MLVRFKTSVAGPQFTFGAGEEVNIPSSQASSFLNFGLIEIIEKEEPAVRPLKVQDVSRTTPKRRVTKKRGRPRTK